MALPQEKPDRGLFRPSQPPPIPPLELEESTTSDYNSPERVDISGSESEGRGSGSPPISPYSPIFKRKSQEEAFQLQKLFEQIFELNSVIRSIIVNVENEETSTNESIRILREEIFGQSTEPSADRFVVIQPKEKDDGAEKKSLLNPQSSSAHTKSRPPAVSASRRNCFAWTSPFWVTALFGVLIILMVLAVLAMAVILNVRGNCEDQDSFHDASFNATTFTWR